MNKLVIAIALCAALAACKKEEAPAAATPAADAAAPAADATAPAADATAPADAAAVAAAPAASGLPQECEDYLNRAKACFAKSGGNAAAAAFQQGIDQSKAQWEAMADKTGLVPAC